MAGPLSGQVAAKELGSLRPPLIDDADAHRFERAPAAPGHPRIRVIDRISHLGDAGGEDRLGAGWRASLVGTGLEAHEERRATGPPAQARPARRVAVRRRGGSPRRRSPRAERRPAPTGGFGAVPAEGAGRELERSRHRVHRGAQSLHCRLRGSNIDPRPKRAARCRLLPSGLSPSGDTTGRGLHPAPKAGTSPASSRQGTPQLRQPDVDDEACAERREGAPEPGRDVDDEQVAADARAPGEECHEVDPLRSSG